MTYPHDSRPAVQAMLNELGKAMCEAAQEPQMKFTVPRRVPMALLRGFIYPADTDDQAVINAAIRQRVHEYVAADELSRETASGIYEQQEAS